MSVALALELGLIVGVAVKLTVGVTVNVTVLVGDGVKVFVAVELGVDVKVSVRVSVGLAVSENVGVIVLVGVEVGVLGQVPPLRMSKLLKFAVPGLSPQVLTSMPIKYIALLIVALEIKVQVLPLVE